MFSKVRLNIIIDIAYRIFIFLAFLVEDYSWKCKCHFKPMVIEKKCPWPPHAYSTTFLIGQDKPQAAG